MNIPPPRPELIEGLFRESQIITVSGGFGVGKSPLLMEWAFCITTGLRWCGRRVIQRPVILLAHESPDWSFWKDWHLLGERYGCAPPAEPDFEAFLEAGSTETESTTELLNALTKELRERLKWLESKAVTKPNALIIVDPFTMFFPVDTKKGNQVMVVYQWCRMLHRRFPSITFMFSFNLRKRSRAAREMPSLLKDPRDWLEEASGGLEIQSRSDVRLGMEYHGPPADGIHVFNGWRRGEPMEPVVLESVRLREDEQGKPLFAGFEPSLLPPEEQAEMLLTPKMAEAWRGMAPGEYSIADLVALKLSKASAYNMKNKLLRAGMVTAAAGGKVVKPE